MTAGMEVIDLIRERLHPREVFGKAAIGKVSHLCVRRAGIEGIWRMGNQRAKCVLAAECIERVRIRRVDCFRAAAARVPREKLKRVCADGKRDAACGGVAFCIAQVATKKERLLFHDTSFLCWRWIA